MGWRFLDRLESYAYVREVDEESRRVTVVASTGDIARDGAIINPDGWDLRAYERNPVVLWGHDDRQPPIGRAVQTTRTPDALIQVHEFATHPRAEEIYQLVRGGFVNAVSVRWLPGETEVRSVGEGKAKRSVLVFTKGHQLLETSFVSVPADPGAVVLRLDGGALDIRDFVSPEPGPEPVKGPSLTERFLAGFAGKGGQHG